MSTKRKNYLAGVFVSTPKTRGEGLKPRRKTLKNAWNTEWWYGGFTGRFAKKKLNG